MDFAKWEEILTKSISLPPNMEEGTQIWYNYVQNFEDYPEKLHGVQKNIVIAGKGERVLTRDTCSAFEVPGQQNTRSRSNFKTCTRTDTNQLRTHSMETHHELDDTKKSR